MTRRVKALQYQSEEDDLTIKYNGENIKVNRFKMLSYSTKYRHHKNIFTLKELPITDDAPLEVFQEFVKAIQGKEFSVNDTNIFQLVKFAAVWKADTVLSILMRSFRNNPNIELLIAEKNAASDPDYSAALDQMIAENINSIIEADSLSKLKLSVLRDILMNKNVTITNYQKFHSYLVSKLDSQNTIIYDLVKYIDMSKLTPEETKQIFTNQKLLKYISANKEQSSTPTMPGIKKEVRANNKRLHKRLKRIENFDLKKHFKDIELRFAYMEDAINKEIKKRRMNQEKQNNIDQILNKKLKNYVGSLTMIYVKAEETFARYDRNQRQQYNNLLEDISNARYSIDPIKDEYNGMKRMLRIANIQHIQLSRRLAEKIKAESENKSEEIPTPEGTAKEE